MTKILMESGGIFNFQGDALVVFCDSDLSYKRNNTILQLFSEKTKINSSQKMVINNSYEKSKEQEDRLLKELTAIGYCEIGNAVITKSYNANVKNYIFVPYTDRENPENKLNYILFHQALRSAFSLASLYEINKLAIPILRIKTPKKDFLERTVADIFGTKEQQVLNEKEIEDITITIIKELKKQAIQEVYLYR